jgi:filamentous hemagglutinin family protein
MKNKNQKAKSYYWKSTLYLAACAIALTNAATARSQIVPDRTLPNNTITLPNGQLIEINGGTTKGNNLFHSFSEFSVPANTTAWFNNATTIENIFTRVTGANISNIEGLIQANGTANLFLLNPAGIIFGNNAALNIGGSIFVSTADSFNFSDGSQFSAVNPEAPPLLTVSIPVGLQYGENPGKITIKGDGHHLLGDPETLSTNRENRPLGIAVAPEKTIALLGGEISIEGGNVTAESGNIEVWAVKNNTQLSVVDNNETYTIEPTTTTINYQDINLTQSASLDVSADSAGSVRLQGRNISLTDGSIVLSDTLGNGKGELLQVNASESIRVDGTTPNLEFPSGFLTEIAPGATGKGSNISIDTKSLTVSGGGYISSSTFSTGKSGSITVNAESIDLVGGVVLPNGYINPSGIFSQAIFSGTGNSGNIYLNTERLAITGGANVSTLTFLGGDSGSIVVNAKEIVLQGTDADGYSSRLNTATGQGEGDAGNIKINTEKLLMLDGGQIIAVTASEGDAGNITIDATKSIALKRTTNDARSGLFANAWVSTGEGGNINLTTPQLTIEEGAAISVSNFHSRNLYPPGQGAAGNLTITADEINLQEGIINAEANSGGKGNIDLTANRILLQDNSLLTTNAKGEANGGSITIKTETLTALDNSDITANAADNFAGQVNITATGIFGTEFRSQITPESDITASSNLGAEFNGVVQLNTPEINPTSGLDRLPTKVIDTTSVVTAQCPASQLGNTFVIIGQGGLPDNPGSSLRATTVWHDLRLIATGEFKEETESRVNSLIQPNNKRNSPVIEAQSWQIGKNGRVILTATTDRVIPTQPIIPYLQCL